MVVPRWILVALGLQTLISTIYISLGYKILPWLPVSFVAGWLFVGLETVMARWHKMKEEVQPK